MARIGESAIVFVNGIRQEKTSFSKMECCMSKMSRYAVSISAKPTAGSSGKMLGSVAGV